MGRETHHHSQVHIAKRLFVNKIINYKTHYFFITIGSKFSAVDLRRIHYSASATPSIRPQTASGHQYVSGIKVQPVSSKLRERCYSTPGVEVKRKKKSKFKRSVMGRWTPSRDSNRTDISVDNTKYARLDAKSLIRQNHRPTTSIKYLPITQSNIYVTPCIRKALISHEAPPIHRSPNPCPPHPCRTNNETEFRIAPVALKTPQLPVTPSPSKTDLCVIELNSGSSEKTPVMPPQSKEFKLALGQCQSHCISNVLKTVSNATEFCSNEVGDKQTLVKLQKYGESIENNCEPLRLIMHQENDDSEDAIFDESVKLSISELQKFDIHIPCNGISEDYREILLKNQRVRTWLEKIEESRHEMANFTDDWGQ